MADHQTYLGNPLLKGSHVQMEFTKEQLAEYIKCSEDPIYFAEKYMKIVTVDEGLVPLMLYDFQKDIMRSVFDNRFTICKIPRQSGKTTTLVSCILHLVLFNPDYKAAILANKLKTATEIMDRVKIAYENLPKWLQQGVREWNKTSVTLENGSKIVCSSTSSSAVRGSAYNFLLLDEFAFVPDQIAEQFFASVYPTITSGKTSKTVIVSTPNGLNLFYKMWQNAKNGKSEFKPVDAHWWQVPGRDDRFKETTIRNTSERQWLSEYECEFLGSQETLVKASKIAALAFTTPILETEEGMTVYENPIKGHIYAATVDSSRSIGQDYNTMTVIDATTVPYKVVCKFRSNTIPVPIFPEVIKQVGSKYNEAYVLVEINDTGQQVADILKDDLEYENVISISIKGKKGQRVGEGFGGARVYNGVKMSAQVKKVGCLILKEMIESDKLILNDFDIISELSTYILKAGSYEATEGYHDDLVATLVMFAWLTTQEYFKDLVNLDVRKRVFEEKIKKLEEDMVPFGFMDIGTDEMDEAVKALSSEPNMAPKPSKRNRSWMDDADEILGQP
jgi:hypothetical protein